MSIVINPHNNYKYVILHNTETEPHLHYPWLLQTCQMDALVATTHTKEASHRPKVPSISSSTIWGTVLPESLLNLSNGVERRSHVHQLAVARHCSAMIFGTSHMTRIGEERRCCSWSRHSNWHTNRISAENTNGAKQPRFLEREIVMLIAQYYQQWTWLCTAGKICNELKNKMCLLASSLCCVVYATTLSVVINTVRYLNLYLVENFEHWKILKWIGLTLHLRWQTIAHLPKAIIIILSVVTWISLWHKGGDW